MLSACGDLSSTVWLQCCSGGSTPVGTQYHTAVSTLAICLQPPGVPSICQHPHWTLQCIHTFNVVLYNTIYNNIQYRPYHMHSTAAILLSCCYLYCCLVPIQSHLITSYLQVTSHQQHMLCVAMPPIGIHRHVHITTAHSNSTYTSPPPNTNTCTTLAASRDIQSMHPCWHTCPWP